MITIRISELSSKEQKNGMRNISIVLHEIYPESTFDDENGIATQTNLNGLGWREKWVAQAIDTVPGKSIRCEFLDEERSTIGGHGATGFDEDNMPEFCDATVVGHFTSAEIQDIEYEDGLIRRVLVGIGEIDAQCYPRFVEYLDENIAAGNDIYGSVEILKTAKNDKILYEYGYHKDQRIPMEYQYSGYAILGIRPADSSAVLIELNEKTNKEENAKMNENEIKALVSQVVTEMNSQTETIEKCQTECEAKIAEANAMVSTIASEKEELVANSEKIQAALDEAREELQKKYDEISALHEELDALREELGKAKAKERIGELNSAMCDFSDEEKAYAQAEIDAFNADPINSEINSVVNKVWEGIGKKAKETAAAAVVVAEQNSANIEDIFAPVELVDSNNEDCNIF